MRKKQSKPSKYYKKYRNYSPDQLLKAYRDVIDNKTPVKRAAKLFGVPRQTLRDRVNGQVNPEDFGRETILSREEELSIVKHAENSARLGYGYTNTALQRLAGEIAYKLGRRETDRPLSNCWLYGFLGRWNNRISSLKPSALDTSRAKCATPESVDIFFSNLKNTVEQLGLQDKPNLIYNMDETGISPEHRLPNVIAPLKEKAQSVTSPWSATTTLIACVNAAGSHIPPYFVFKGKRMNNDLMKGASAGVKAIMSDNGWSTIEVFQDYLENHFLKNITRDDNQLILLILDAHTTHTSPLIIRWALSKNIHIFCLPAHTSHILQPLDVAVFGPFKRFYYSECAAHMKDHMGRVVSKYDMAKIACSAYLKAMGPSNIVSAFRNSGIFPCNKEAIAAEKLYPCEAFRDSTPMLKIKALKSGKESLDKYLEDKFANKENDTSSCTCTCKKKVSHKPNASGRELGQGFLDEVELYNSQKENIPPPQPAKLVPTSNKVQAPTPAPSTSGLNRNIDAVPLPVRKKSPRWTSQISRSVVCVADIHLQH